MASSWRGRAVREELLTPGSQQQLRVETVRLQRGDAFTFRGSESHTWHNTSDTESAEVLWVLAPAP